MIADEIQSCWPVRVYPFACITGCVPDIYLLGKMSAMVAHRESSARISANDGRCSVINPLAAAIGAPVVSMVVWGECQAFSLRKLGAHSHQRPRPDRRWCGWPCAARMQG